MANNAIIEGTTLKIPKDHDTGSVEVTATYKAGTDEAQTSVATINIETPVTAITLTPSDASVELDGENAAQVTFSAKDQRNKAINAESVVIVSDVDGDGADITDDEKKVTVITVQQSDAPQQVDETEGDSTGATDEGDGRTDSSDGSSDGDSGTEGDDTNPPSPAASVYAINIPAGHGAGKVTVKATATSSAGDAIESDPVEIAITVAAPSS